MELVRTRLAVSSEGTYRGMGDCVRRTMKHEGFRAFYRGLTPSLVSPPPPALLPLDTRLAVTEPCRIKGSNFHQIA